MTEEEAKTKWCPHTRQCGAVAYNRNSVGKPSGMCVGSACMSWRWDRYAVKTRDLGGMSIDTGEIETSTTRGYCGLAGHP